MLFIETRSFTARVTALFDDLVLARMQQKKVLRELAKELRAEATRALVRRRSDHHER